MDPREQMNAQYRQIVSRLQVNAERDVRLARAGGQPHELAKAQARLDTLTAALEIYVAVHRVAYGQRPWPQAEVQS